MENIKEEIFEDISDELSAELNVFPFPVKKEERLEPISRPADAPLNNQSPAKLRSLIFPAGSWPPRMTAEMAAAYCGERTVDAFLDRVGKEYPNPRVKEGRRQIWLKDDLDAAILPPELGHVRDAAGDL